MSDNSPSQLYEELQTLRHEVKQLRRYKQAFEAQNQLVQALISVSQASTGRLMLRSMLLETIKITCNLTEAEDSSLFLLDEYGVVMESILARGAAVREVKENLIGQVLDKGLAGWVVQNKQVGLIADTRRDDRWLTLPNQPYTVGSALCVPILRGRDLLGILTLTHSEPEKFDLQTSYLMEMCANQMALALHNARQQLLATPANTSNKSKAETEEVPEALELQLNKLGVYIISVEGRFMYVNQRFAEIFEYTLPELLELKSIGALVAKESRLVFTENLQPCCQGTTTQVDFKFTGRGKNGKTINLAIEGSRTKFYGKFAIIGILAEI